MKKIHTNLLGSIAYLSKIGLWVLLLTFGCINAQKKSAMQSISIDPVVCPAKFKDMHTKHSIPELPALEFQKRMKKNASVQFDVTFGEGALANPEAQQAFQFALDIWANELVSSVPIRVFVDFASLGQGVLAQAGPTSIFSNFPNAPKENFFYPAALANSLAGEQLNVNQDVDLVVSIGDSLPWYFGLDGNTPSGQFDFVTVALHELGHGLGFINLDDFNFLTGEGVLSPNGDGVPAIFSDFIINGDGERITSFEEQSVTLGNQLTSNDLFIDGFNTVAATGDLAKIFAPPAYQSGSSISHWDEITYPAGNPNSLMTPTAGTAESNFDIGEITRGFFKDMGWQLAQDITIIPFTISPTSITANLKLGEPQQVQLNFNNISDTNVTIVANQGTTNTFVDFGEGTERVLQVSGMDSLTVTLDPEGFPIGTYQDTILITNSTTTDTLFVPLNIKVLDSVDGPRIIASPDSLTSTLPMEQFETQQITLENLGSEDLLYSINILDPNRKTFEESVQETKKNLTQNGFEHYQVSDKALQLKNVAKEFTPFHVEENIMLRSSLYATDFETFELGNLDSQEGWDNIVPFADWQIEETNPFEGSRHLRATSQGGQLNGRSFALSPAILEGNQETAFTRFSAALNLQGEGTKWRIVLQNVSVLTGSFTETQVTTPIDINSDRTVEVGVQGQGFVQLDTRIPDGYFNLTVQIDNTDQQLSILFDDEVVFTGVAQDRGFNQVAFVTEYQEGLSTLDIDNFEISAEDKNPFFLSTSPTSGIIAPLENTTVDVKFDARGIEPGTYLSSIEVLNNDATNNSVVIPATLVVEDAVQIQVSTDSIAVVIDVENEPLLKSENLTISNTGSGRLNYFSGYGDHQVTLPTPTREITEKFTDSIIYDTNMPSSGGTAFFPTVGNASSLLTYSTAIRFDLDRNFELSAVRNYVDEDLRNGSEYLLEIYRGGSEPTSGQLVHTQLIKTDDSNNFNSQGFVLENLIESIRFNTGDTFWVVHKYPQQFSFYQGYDSEAEAVSGRYQASNNNGETWEIINFPFVIRALSGDNGRYVTLQPDEDTVPANETMDVEVLFDATQAPNGIYNTELLIKSNDPSNPVVTVPTRLEVKGQKPAITLGRNLILYNNVFIGDSLTRSVRISNPGLSQLVVNASSNSAEFGFPREEVVINAKESSIFEIVFSPTFQGNRNATITLNHNVEGMEDLEIAVNGIGVSPPIAVFDPGEISTEVLDNGTVNRVTSRLINRGEAPLFYTFPLFSAQNAMKRADFKVNNTEYIPYSKSYQGDFSETDTRQGHTVISHVGTDNNEKYLWIDNQEPGGPIYNFLDIQDLGINLLETQQVDATSFKAPLPLFDFSPYESNSKSKRKFSEDWKISSNGYLFTGTINYNQNLQLQDVVSNKIIAPFWDHLFVGPDSKISVLSEKERYIVQWTNMYASPDLKKDETITFQAVLYPDDTIDFYYKDVSNASFVNSATIGIAGNKKSDFTQIAFNTPYVKDKLAIRLMNMAQDAFIIFGVETADTNGFILPGQGIEVDFTVGAPFECLGRDCAGETFRGRYKASTNAPFQFNDEMVITIDVKDAPEAEDILSLSRKTVNFRKIELNQTKKRRIILSNISEVDAIINNLEFSNDFVNPGDFELDLEAPITLKPGDSITATISYTPSLVDGFRVSEFLLIDFISGISEFFSEVLLRANPINPEQSLAFNNEKSGYQTWQLYPNPVTDIVTISSPLGLNEDVSVKLKNLIGQDVILDSDITRIDSGDLTLDMSRLSKGFYLLQVQGQNRELLFSKKIIKK